MSSTCVVDVKKMKGTLTFIKNLSLSLIFAVGALAAVQKTTQKFTLGETEVKINLYENAGSKVTFFSPHHNEQIARNLAKEFVEKKGGRLVEIESLDTKGKPSRYINFKANGKTFSLDPNRIYTENGRNCDSLPAEIDLLVKDFADKLLKLIFADGKERFIVAVHNNTDVDSKEEHAKQGDLTALAFVKTAGHGTFQSQAEGAFLSNLENDSDNFIFLSSAKYLGFFVEKSFNVVVQKSANKLRSTGCNVDDGSLSVFTAQNNIQYICLEADGLSGRLRQQQMFEAVYALLKEQNAVGDKTVAVK
ncbi:MAG: hypothetical protein HC846_12620 [Blastocatellia bacterium]|nr:hypothetical protein [Blastocatellia bacterium]